MYIAVAYVEQGGVGACERVECEFTTIREINVNQLHNCLANIGILYLVALSLYNLSKMIHIREIKQRVPFFFKTEKGG